MQKKMKRLLSIMLCCAMAICCALPAFAETASAADAAGETETADYIGHWAEEYMQAFVEAGYLEGKGGNFYDPDGELTRAEMMALINRVVGYTELADDSAVSAYTDVDTEEWYYETVAIALEAGYVEGTSESTMGPEDTMTRQEAITLAGRIVYGEDYVYSGSDVLSGFPDSDEVSDWAEDYMAALVSDGTVNGRGDGTLSPTEIITRAEAVKILYYMEDDLASVLNGQEADAGEEDAGTESEDAEAGSGEADADDEDAGTDTGNEEEDAGDGNENAGGEDADADAEEEDSSGEDAEEDADTENEDADNGDADADAGDEDADSGEEESEEEEISYVYVLMNVPYSDFYSVLGDEDVDAVASATGTKTRTVNQTMAGGAYHVNADGSDITGIIYYVYLPESALEELNEVTDETEVSYSVTNKGNTTEYEFTGADALVEAESYSYYLLDEEDEEPAYYLTAEEEEGALTFTGLEGEITEVEDPVSYSFYTDTSYGDYELDLDSETISSILGDSYVSALTLNTTDGSVYGLRHVENIWKGYELSWSTGHSTTEIHGNTLAYENYEDLEGKTIESVTYYTTSGIYVLELAEECYVTPYAADVTAEQSGEDSIEISGIPEDAENVEIALLLGTDVIESSYDAETGILSAELEEGTYTISITSDNYAFEDISIDIEGYTYLYAALTWEEYYENEDVYAAGDATSVEETDGNGETDLGAFDVVTRATTKHGLHRGSYQCTAVIYDTDGNAYYVASWSDDGSTITLTDGTSIGWSSGTITLEDGTTATMSYYEIEGYKYVPVRVANSELEDFCEQYTVTLNGETLAGGYSENNLSAYTYTAEVDADTNNLKIATQNEDGSFSFSAAQTGTGSGLADVEQKVVDEDSITVTVKDYDGSYGEFVRVDLTGDGYGDLGASMQSVTWTYYGDDDTYTEALETYGTKFASDCWMHKSNGIQLGLTDSLRCQLPEGYDGTGYWTITIHALGYEDYTFEIVVTEDNIPTEIETITEDQIEALESLIEAGNDILAGDSSLTELAEHVAEAEEMIADAESAATAADELIAELEALIDEYEYTYLYAALTWEEYYENEDVYAAGDATSVDETDSNGETDLGAFDVVTRATTKHGLHRGSYQCTAVIYDTDGNAYYVASWSDDGSTITLTDGTSIGWSSGTITLEDGTTATMSYYEIEGYKYVPVKVYTGDLAVFCEQYTVTLNGETLAGGYSENNLSAYTYTAEVDENTNNLKTATLNEDGTFSFSAAQTGTGSGLADVEQKVVDEDSITVTVKDYDGSYGEFVRVDLTGDGYGDLGASMQSVTWTYYGDDDTYTEALETYGTKFASDCWMHKSNGIQLGLTDSLRCQLPEGYDGTGYWTITIHALGYEDYTFEIVVTEDNIPSEVELISDEQISTLESLIEEGQAYVDEDSSLTELAAHIAEAEEMIADPEATATGAEELIAELEALIAEAEENAAAEYTVSIVTYPDEDEDFIEYGITVTVTVQNDVVTGLSADIVDETEDYEDNVERLGRALNGRTTSKNTYIGLVEQICGMTISEASTLTLDDVDVVSTATCSCDSIVSAVQSIAASLSE